MVNQSDAILENVVLSGSGFSAHLGSVRPNAELRVMVRPKGESGLQIHFDARSKRVSFGPAGYFEAAGAGGGYMVTVTVSPSLGVSVRSELAY